MEPQKLIVLVAFVVCCCGVAAGCLLGLAGIWIKDFSEVGWKLFMSDVVITLAALLIAGLTTSFWK